MNQIMLDRLVESFGELERAILSAKTTLKGKANTPKEVLERIDSYESILAKQKTLAAAIPTFASEGNWIEVARHIRLINGLSAMIRDDARELLAGANPTMSTEPRELMLS